MCIYLLIYIITLDYFRVFLFEHLIFFECFFCCWLCPIWLFVNIFQAWTSHIFMRKQNGRQAIGSILPSRIANPWKPSKPNKSKGLLSSCEVKLSGWFTTVGYTRVHFRITYVCHGFILCTIYTCIIWMKVSLGNKLNEFCHDTFFFFLFSSTFYSKFCFSLSEETKISLFQWAAILD